MFCCQLTLHLPCRTEGVCVLYEWAGLMEALLSRALGPTGNRDLPVVAVAAGPSRRAEVSPR